MQYISATTLTISGIQTESGGTIAAGGVLSITDGGFAQSDYLLPGSTEYVLSGGQDSASSEFSSAAIYVSNYGTVADDLIAAGGLVVVGSTGLDARNIVFGTITASSGGTVQGAQLSAGGTVAAASGSDILNAMIYGGASPDGSYSLISIGSGASLSFSYLIGSGNIVDDGGTDTSCTVWNCQSGCSITVESGGVSSDTHIDGGSLIVGAGGTALDPVISAFNYLPSLAQVNSGGTTSGTLIAQNATLTVSGGGLDEGATLYGGGEEYVLAGGTANSFTLDSGGTLVWTAGAVINGQAMASSGSSAGSGGSVPDPNAVYGGTVVVYDGGVVSGREFDGNGISVGVSGTAEAIVLSGVGSHGALETISSGGTASGTIAEQGGTVTVSNGGTADAVTLDNGGYEYVLSGGTANDIILSGGTVSWGAGAIIGGVTMNAAGTSATVATQSSGGSTSSGGTAVSSGGSTSSSGTAVSSGGGTGSGGAAVSSGGGTGSGGTAVSSGGGTGSGGAAVSSGGGTGSGGTGVISGGSTGSSGTGVSSDGSTGSGGTEVSSGGSTGSGGTSGLSLVDTTTSTPVSATVQAYTGPVSGITSQCIYTGDDGLNVTLSTGNWFIHTGSGTNAVALYGGRNVVDGGDGSSFLTAGTGTDTFYVDDRAPTEDIWSTVVNFHSGDDATVWGITPADFNLNWVNNDGAAGYQGLTLHATTPDEPTASLTLAGFSTADLTNGKLTVSYGTVDGNNYMHIQAN